MSSERLTQRPRAVVVAVSGLWLEVAAGTALTVLFLTEAVGADAGTALPILLMALMIAGFTGVLALTARALWRGLRWPRSLALTWQLFQVVVALPLLGGALGWIAVLAIALAVGVVACLFSPSSAAWAHRTAPTGT